MVTSANWERLLWIVALIPLGTTYASSQQSPDLDQQLQQLKQQYEQTTQALQGRISALELQIAEQKIMTPNETKASVSVSQLAAEQTVGKVFTGEAGKSSGNSRSLLPLSSLYGQSQPQVFSSTARFVRRMASSAQANIVVTVREQGRGSSAN